MNKYSQSPQLCEYFFMKKDKPDKPATTPALKKKTQPKSEYLESFIAFGYTYSGERILIQHAINARDKDALQEFIKNVFITTTKDNLIIDKDTDE